MRVRVCGWMYTPPHFRELCQHVAGLVHTLKIFEVVYVKHIKSSASHKDTHALTHTNTYSTLCLRRQERWSVTLRTQHCLFPLFLSSPLSLIFHFVLPEARAEKESMRQVEKEREREKKR